MKVGYVLQRNGPSFRDHKTSSKLLRGAWPRDRTSSSSPHYSFLYITKFFDNTRMTLQFW